MHHNFNNPHGAYQQMRQQQMMNQGQMPQMQTGMNPMQMQITPQMLAMFQQTNPQMYVMMLQQNPQLVQMAMQMNLPVPQGMMMQPNQQFMPNQMPLMQNQRFANSSVPQGTMQSQHHQQFEPQTQVGGRFSSEAEPQEEEVPVDTIPNFVVNPKAVAVPLTKKLGITPKVSAFTPKILASVQEICWAYSLEDAVDEAIKVSQTVEGEKLLYTIDSVVINEAFKVPFDPGYTKLFSDDVKALYKRLRGLYETATTMDTVIMLERVDNLMTELTNHYLKVHFNNQINIDRFSTDFNDLLKLLRTDFEDEEDDLWEFLGREIMDIHKLLSEDPHQKHEFSIIRPTSIVYFKEHHFKAGLAGVTSMVRLPEVQSNEFLLTTARAIKELTDRASFYLATYDRNTYRFTINKHNEVFVEKVS